MSTFLIEGLWSPEPHVICHRDRFTGEQASYQAIDGLRFADGTCLLIRVRGMEGEEDALNVQYSLIVEHLARQKARGLCDVRAVWTERTH